MDATVSRGNRGQLTGVALALLCAAAWPAGAAPMDVLQVPGEFPTIQDAINAAANGDEIAVAPGVYPERIHLLGKAIMVRSTDGPVFTVIDASDLNQDVVICTNLEGSDTVLEGFTITGGINGMLVRLAEPTVANCLITGNISHGMHCDEGGPVVLESAFSGNGKAGVYTIGGSPVFESCAFDDNGAGGMLNFSAAAVTLLACSFAENHALFGAGLRNVDDCDVQLVNCIFTANHAGLWGGGLCNDNHCDAVLVNCLFIGNTAEVDGGAVYNLESSPAIINCTFSGNAAANAGGGLFQAGGAAAITNCIFWNNAGGEILNDPGAPVVTYCDVEGGYQGEGNIDADPLFVDPENGDYRLAPGSPCIDAADNTAVPPDGFDLDEDGDTEEPIPFDLDGHPRFVDDPETEDTGYGEPPIVDMGACEYQGPECPADFDGDGDVDTVDSLHLLGCWGDGCGDVDGDGDTDTADLLALLAAWGECP